MFDFTKSPNLTKKKFFFLVGGWGVEGARVSDFFY